MHWAYKVAKELISKYPNKDTFVCASGISPSGSVHIGNFREVVTTHFVVKALTSFGKKTRFIFSWDDFDRFRKIPSNIDSSFEKYIGMPYSEIPDPHGCHSSYAEHFEKEFERSVREFGIDAEFIYQSEEYKSGRYNKYILHALKNRREIYNILMDFKTNGASEEEKNAFYPVSIYCDTCRKDNTKITRIDDRSETLEYTCECGNHNVLYILDARNIKLNWKIDWPMRWMIENVVFEPGGRDHSSETGSYNVSKVVSQKIFNHEPPDYVAYDFIGIKGAHAKMSSSSGHNITPEELLKIYSPENILFLFAKYRPDAAFNIALDEDVIRNHSELERYRGSQNYDTLNDDIRCSIELSEINHSERNEPNFNQVAGILPLVNFDVGLVKEVLSKTGVHYTLEDISRISKRAEYWIKNWYPQKMIALNEKKNHEYYHGLSNIQKKWLNDLCMVINNSEYQNEDQLMQNVYSICHDDEKSIKRNNQKLLFSIVYKLVLNSTSGPRLPVMIQALGVNGILNLIDFVND